LFESSGGVDMTCMWFEPINSTEAQLGVVTQRAGNVLRL
jgi:hypothetical protein